jgi:hypothetical protein
MSDLLRICVKRPHSGSFHRAFTAPPRALGVLNWLVAAQAYGGKMRDLVAHFCFALVGASSLILVSCGGTGDADFAFSQRNAGSGSSVGGSGGSGSGSAGSVGANGTGGAVAGSTGTGGAATAGGGGAGVGGAASAGGNSGSSGNPDASSDAASQCSGTHPLLDAGARFCEQDACYCRNSDSCFPTATAWRCCESAPVCAWDMGAPTCTGTHPLLDAGARYCGPGQCRCVSTDACFPKWQIVMCCAGTSVCF